MNDPDLEQRIFEAQAEVCKTFSNPWRLRIVEALGSGQATVSELVEALGVRTALVSQHLGIMRDKGIVDARRDGTRVYYRLADPRVLAACRLMREVLLTRMERDGAMSRSSTQNRGRIEVSTR